MEHIATYNPEVPAGAHCRLLVEDRRDDGAGTYELDFRDVAERATWVGAVERTLRGAQVLRAAADHLVIDPVL